MDFTNENQEKKERLRKKCTPRLNIFHTRKCKVRILSHFIINLSVVKNFSLILLLRFQCSYSVSGYFSAFCHIIIHVELYVYMRRFVHQHSTVQYLFAFQITFVIRDRFSNSVGTFLDFPEL